MLGKSRHTWGIRETSQFSVDIPGGWQTSRIRVDVPEELEKYPGLVQTHLSNYGNIPGQDRNTWGIWDISQVRVKTLVELGDIPGYSRDTW